MSRLIEARINVLADQIAAEGMILRAADVRAGAVEISRQRHEIERLTAARDAAMRVHVEDGAEIERLQGVIQQLNEGNDVLATRYCDSKAEIEKLQLLVNGGIHSEREARAEIESLRDQQISAVNGMLRAEQEAARLRDVLTWTEQNCPGKCAGVVRAALEHKP